MGADQSHLMPSTELQNYKDGTNYISFFVNGKEFNVNLDSFDPEYGPYYVLVDYLREKIGLTGTKYMCLEGGCGMCTVMIKSIHPRDGHQVVRSVNSCMLPLFSCDGLDITTIEQIGSTETAHGYHEIQDRLVKFGGTQCGFCSPSFVMNMYSYAQVNPKFTGGNVEYSLDGNICRCTGYRPIMDAFKSLSSKMSEELRRKCLDIEECYKCPLPPIAKSVDSFQILQTPRNFRFRNRASISEWIKVITLPALFDMIERLSQNRMRYRLLAGNTAAGIYKHDGLFSAYIDINDIPELHGIVSDKSGITLGGSTSLTEAIDQFMAMTKMDGYVYASEFAKHFRRIASLTIRNVATLAGNLMIKRDHPEFPSDIFVLFESIGATVAIASSPSLLQTYKLVDFLNLDMYGKVITSIHLPTFGKNYEFRCFKISNRYQNCHSEVNAAMLFEIDKNGYRVLSKPSLCYGGISPTFVHANATEDYLISKRFNSTTLRESIKILDDEVKPSFSLTASSPSYRKGLAVSLFYKFILRVMRESVSPPVKTGGDDVDRGLNTGTQTFDTDPSKYPLYQPIPKLESFPQVSGKAEFINDIPIRPDELFGAFVLSNVGKAKIVRIDPAQALLTPGVEAFISAKDVPGLNNYAVFGTLYEEIFASSEILYYGQPIGLILAKNRHAAYRAREKVTIQYKDIKKPVTDIKELVNLQTDSKSEDLADLSYPCRGITKDIAKNIISNLKTKSKQLSLAKTKDLKSTKTILGEFVTRGQYHFHMETQTALTIPKEDGMDVYSSTQSIDNVQAAIASALHIPSNSINIFIRRIGGGFGGKSTKANHIATACAVASYKTGKPVRIVLDLETNMLMIGKRLPYLTKYEATADDNGKILKLQARLYCDTGAVANEASSLFATVCVQSCYRADKWDVSPGVVSTNTAPNTVCRSPGSAQAIAAIENIMEHVAQATRKDPLEIRLENFISKGDPLIGIPGATLTTDNPLRAMIEELKVSSDYESRKKFIQTHNKSNRWRKRGLSLVPQRVPIHYADFRLPTFLSVFHVDGTVSVSHAGIEMGQGINTKVAQVVAYTLNIPLESVRVKPTNNLISPNSAFTAASVTSELVCHSAREACYKLLAKMDEVRKELRTPTWQELVTACHTRGILLTAQHQDQSSSGDIISYDVWGATVTEVEVDVLTGDYRIIRVDIIEDAGSSLNSLLDIGQIEGAFVMGLGWLLTEKLVYDPENGELLTRNTWHYKPQLPADIPEDFRITLLKNKPNPYGVMSSKATSEPPLNMSVSVIFAIRQAIDSARNDAGIFEWYQMDTPVTREDIRKLASTSLTQFIL